MIDSNTMDSRPLSWNVKELGHHVKRNQTDCVDGALPFAKKYFNTFKKNLK